MALFFIQMVKGKQMQKHKNYRQCSLTILKWLTIDNLCCKNRREIKQHRPMMEKVRKVYHRDKEILIIDYTECKTDRMIEISNKVKYLIQTDNKHVLVLSIFNKNYVTPDFMRHVEKGIKEVESLIDRNAIIGLSEIQKWILKGVNIWYKRQMHSFDSFDEGLEFLVSGDKIDQSNKVR